MYRQKGSMGARVGALFLDGLIISAILAAALFISPGLYLILSFVGAVLYYGFCEGSSLHASLGKRMCGLIVVDKDGMPIGYATAFLRALCRVLSGACLGVGFFMGFFDPNGAALHDRIAGTFVASRGTAQPVIMPAPAPAPPGPQKGVTTMNPQIIGISGQFAGRAFPVSPQGTMMGREPASCDFVFPDGAQGISRNHCKLQFNPQTQMFILYDLGSSYGTFLGNGMRVPQGQPAALRVGDEFYLGSRANVFRVSL